MSNFPFRAVQTNYLTSDKQVRQVRVKLIVEAGSSASLLKSGLEGQWLMSRPQRFKR